MRLQPLSYVLFNSFFRNDTASGSYSEALNILGEYVEICTDEEMDEELDEGMSMV